MSPPTDCYNGKHNKKKRNDISQTKKGSCIASVSVQTQPNAKKTLRHFFIMQMDDYLKHTTIR